MKSFNPSKELVKKTERTAGLRRLKVLSRIETEIVQELNVAPAEIKMGLEDVVAQIKKAMEAEVNYFQKNL